MLRRLLARFLGSQGGTDEQSGDEGETDRGFVPSRLDASVLYAHGMGDPHAELEMASLEEHERLFDDQRRRNG